MLRSPMLPETFDCPRAASGSAGPGRICDDRAGVDGSGYPPGAPGGVTRCRALHLPAAACGGLLRTIEGSHHDDDAATPTDRCPASDELGAHRARRRHRRRRPHAGRGRSPRCNRSVHCHLRGLDGGDRPDVDHDIASVDHVLDHDPSRLVHRRLGSHRRHAPRSDLLPAVPPTRRVSGRRPDRLRHRARGARARGLRGLVGVRAQRVPPIHRLRRPAGPHQSICFPVGTTALRPSSDGYVYPPRARCHPTRTRLVSRRALGRRRGGL